jgi:hypothetical protein
MWSNLQDFEGDNLIRIYRVKLYKTQKRQQISNGLLKAWFGDILIIFYSLISALKITWCVITFIDFSRGWPYNQIYKEALQRDKRNNTKLSTIPTQSIICLYITYLCILWTASSLNFIDNLHRFWRVTKLSNQPENKNEKTIQILTNHPLRAPFCTCPISIRGHLKYK